MKPPLLSTTTSRAAPSAGGCSVPSMYPRSMSRSAGPGDVSTSGAVTSGAVSSSAVSLGALSMAACWPAAAAGAGAPLACDAMLACEAMTASDGAATASSGREVETATRQSATAMASHTFNTLAARWVVDRLGGDCFTRVSSSSSSNSSASSSSRSGRFFDHHTSSPPTAIMSNAIVVWDPEFDPDATRPARTISVAV